MDEINKSTNSWFQKFIFGITTVLILFSLTVAANYMINQKSVKKAEAKIENKNLVFGMVGSVELNLNAFSLLFESSHSPVISGIGKTRWNVKIPLFPKDRETDGVASGCYKVESFSNLNSGEVISCDKIIRTGNQVAVAFIAHDQEQGILVAKAVISEN